MKKTLTKIFATIICFVICFAFVGCTQFSGDFTTKATSQEIENTFEKIEDTEIATDDVTGIQMVMSMNITDLKDSTTSESKMSIKANFDKDEAAMTYTAINEEQNTDIGIYIKSKTLYYNFIYNSEETQTSIQRKTNMSDDDDFDADEILDYSDSVGMGIDVSEIFSYGVETLEEMGAEVYIDDSTDTLKIKIVFNGKTTEDGEKTTGSAVYVFDKDYDIVACKYNLTLATDEHTMQIDLILQSYSGSIKLPKGAEDWKESFDWFD